MTTCFTIYTESERGTIKSVVNPRCAWATGGVILLIVVDQCHRNSHTVTFKQDYRQCCRLDDQD